MKKKLTHIQNHICNISIIIGCLLTVYYLGLALIYQYVAFSIWLGLTGITLTLFGALQKHYQVFWFQLLNRPSQYFILVILSIGIFIFTVAEGFILFYGHSKSQEKGDVILVLGSGLNKDKISATLKYRLDTALEAHQQQPDIPIIVSGGKGNRETITEAKAMYDYLVEHGVSKQQIIKEEQSTDTYENFIFSKQILPHKDAKVLVITNNFHMLRAMILAQKTGLNAYRYPSPDHIPTSFNFHIREFFGLMKDLVIH